MKISSLLIAILLAAQILPLNVEVEFDEVPEMNKFTSTEAEFVNLDSVEVLPNLTNGRSEIISVKSEPGKFELICGNVRGVGNLGEDEFETYMSIFIRFRSRGNNIEIASDFIEGYYPIDPLLPSVTPRIINVTHCGFGDGKIFAVGYVSGHHEFYGANISSPFNDLHWLIPLRFILIIDLENNSTHTSYISSVPLNAHMSADGRLFILTKITPRWMIFTEPGKNVSRANNTLDEQFLRPERTGVFYGLMEINGVGELISHHVISTQISAAGNPCSFQWIDTEFDDFSNSLHLLGKKWEGCKLSINGEELLAPHQSNSEWHYYLRYSWDTSNFTQAIPDLISGDTSTWEVVPYGSISSSEEGILITMNRQFGNFSVMGENFTQSDQGSMIIIHFDSKFNHTRTKLVGTVTELLPSEVISIRGNLIFGGSFCYWSIPENDCILRLDNISVSRNIGWDAFIAVADINGHWRHLSVYGAGNWDYSYPILPPKSGIHEFPSIIESIGEIGFIVVIRFSEQVEYAGTTIPAKQSAIFRFHFDSDLDGQRDEIDNCVEVMNSGQENLDSDEFGDLCDFDIDGDSIYNERDDCPHGETNWLSDTNSDIDSDGCRDISEDEDDDSDLIVDHLDNCVEIHNPNQVDYDEDGQGDSCDSDIDDDGILNQYDSCPSGVIHWESNMGTDRDEDGCEDSTEDLDDDNDGFPDSEDSCPKGVIGWIPSRIIDLDQDGCLDSTEDSDDDGDGIPDYFDDHPLDATRWIGLRYALILSISSLLVIGYIITQRIREEQMIQIDDSEE